MAALCVCGDVQQQHRLGEHGCRSRECDCTRYEPDAPPPAEESTSARLRRVEQERDELRTEVERLVDLGGEALAKRDQAIENGDAWVREAKPPALSCARTELDAVRTARDNLERALYAANRRIEELEHPLITVQIQNEGAPPE